MFSRILSELQSDREDRENFRLDVKRQFDQGASVMEALRKDLAEVRIQTTKTNGRVLASEGEIQGIKAHIETVAAGMCPGKCWPLEKDIKKIQDTMLLNKGRAEGVMFSGRAIWWFIGGGAAAIVTVVKFLGAA